MRITMHFEVTDKIGTVVLKGVCSVSSLEKVLEEGLEGRKGEFRLVVRDFDHSTRKVIMDKFEI